MVKVLPELPVRSILCKYQYCAVVIDSAGLSPLAERNQVLPAIVDSDGINKGCIVQEAESLI